MKHVPKMFAVTAVILSFLVLSVSVVSADGSREYTVNADFDEGNMNNVNYDIPDQLQLSEETEPFNFIWVAVSSRGTIVKIDTDTGAVLGEYLTHPTLTGLSANPSRTTVDLNGDVWVANRGGIPGTITHYAAIPTDKNANGTIETSSGLGDILPWGTDEAFLHHVAVSSSGTRHVSVDANNDVW